MVRADGKTRKGQTTEREILKKALAKLAEITGLEPREVEWEIVKEGLMVDARIDLEPPLKPMWVEIKRTFTPAQMGPAMAQMKRLRMPRLLVAPYITPPLAEKLRQEGVQFLDCQGNAYLNLEKPRVLIWVTGKRPPKRLPAERPLTVFRAAGLRVIFPFLCLPETTEVTYRTLARMAGVALGTVANTIVELQHLGYIRKVKNGFILENRERLLDAWVDAYPRELRPLLDVRRFKTEKKDWWHTVDWTRLNGIWLGGEAAAGKLTKYLRAVNATVYLTGGLNEIAGELRLRKDQQGNVELLHKFWFFDHPGDTGEPRMVPPLLVYADLVATGNARNIETAEIIRERYLG